MTTFIWKNINDVIDDVTMSQIKSNFEIDISPSIFELERRSKAQNIRNANGYFIFEMVTASIMSRCDFENSQISRPICRENPYC